MEIEVFPEEAEGDSLVVGGAQRVETVIEAQDGQQYKILIVEADDEVMVVIHYPNSGREIVWSLMREKPNARR